VPAPRPFKPERQDPQPSPSTSEGRSYSTPQFSHTSANHFRIYPNPPPPPAPFQSDSGDEDHKHSRKRFRTERGNPMPVDDLIIDGPISGVSMDRPTSIDLDPSLTRELTNRSFSASSFLLTRFKYQPYSFFYPLPSCTTCHTQTDVLIISEPQSRPVSSSSGSL